MGGSPDDESEAVIPCPVQVISHWGKELNWPVRGQPFQLGQVFGVRRADSNPAVLDAVAWGQNRIDVAARPHMA